MTKFSLFKGSFSDTPDDKLTLDDFTERIKTGYWKKIVEQLRAKKEQVAFKKLKIKLPAVTVSGDFKTRDKQVDLAHRLKSHSGLICLDVDRKDNPKLRTGDLVDKECIAQFLSCSGEGLKIIYQCTPVKTAEEHRRIYDAAVLRLEKKGITLKVDPIVKSIASLQYVSYDPELFYNKKTRLVLRPLPPIKRPKAKPSADTSKDLEQLGAYVDALAGKDVTKDYEDWLLIMFGLSYSLGEAGRAVMHRICEAYPEYSMLECDEKYDICLERDNTHIEKPVTLATVYQILGQHIAKPKLKQLAKRFNKGHAVGVGEDEGNGDLAGFVRYKLFLFKKIWDKETNTLIELIPATINLNEFERLMRSKGFYRFEKKFVHIQEQIVEEADVNDILRIVTNHIEQDGDYIFTYKGTEFKFGWEEIVHLWRSIRAQGTTYNQISSSLDHWVPDLLTDTVSTSYIPYLNGIVKVTAKGHELVPYGELKCEGCGLRSACQKKNASDCEKPTKQIWKERILQRNFTYVPKPGMFEDFFANVMGRGDTPKTRIASNQYKKALWYFGYMLQGSKRQSTARAWLLYDIRTGNNGRSGKTIIGTAIGKIRSVVTLDGKRVDFTDKFAFQSVQPWTDVVFIDDPSRTMSIVPLFNMITGDLAAEPKGGKPIIKQVKFLIASNWVLESGGESETGRQFVTQLDDFYVRYSREHKDTLTPLVDLHGKEFFTDWSTQDWAAFDSFAVRAVIAHLFSPPPASTSIGNARLMRFIQVYEEEMFFDLASILVQHLQPTANKSGWMIARQALISIITEASEGIKVAKAGRIAREFLEAVGGGKIEVTSASSGGQIRMMYKIEKSPQDLDFGEFGKRLKTR